jgi:hypothetical protein
MNEYEAGTRVQIMCHDGAEFEGVLMDDFTDTYFKLMTPKGPLGFPHDDVRIMNAV